jgi:hypothetical protein
MALKCESGRYSSIIATFSCVFQAVRVRCCRVGRAWRAVGAVRCAAGLRGDCVCGVARGCAGVPGWRRPPLMPVRGAGAWQQRRAGCECVPHCAAAPVAHTRCVCETRRPPGDTRSPTHLARTPPARAQAQLTPVPAPRSTHTRSLRSLRRAAQAASMGRRPHRKLALNLSSAASGARTSMSTRTGGAGLWRYPTAQAAA